MSTPHCTGLIANRTARAAAMQDMLARSVGRVTQPPGRRSRRQPIALASANQKLSAGRWTCAARPERQCFEARRGKVTLHRRLWAPSENLGICDKHHISFPPHALSRNDRKRCASLRFRTARWPAARRSALDPADRSWSGGVFFSAAALTPSPGAWAPCSGQPEGLWISRPLYHPGPSDLRRTSGHEPSPRSGIEPAVSRT